MKPPSAALTLARSLTTKKGRAVHGMYLAAGARVIAEAISANQQIEFLLVSPSDMTSTGMKLLDSTKRFQVYEASSHDFRHIDPASTTQGLLAVIRKENAQSAATVTFGDRILALDSINDPSNLGAIVRSALAFGFNDVLLSQGCVELYSPKVIGASAGNLFHLRIIDGVALSTNLASLRADGYSVIGTDADGEDLRPDDRRADKLCLVIGNEARGIAPETRATCDFIARVAIADRCESLSAPVAAGILMHDLCKARTSGAVERNRRDYDT